MGLLGSILGKSAADVVVKIGADSKELDTALNKTETGLGSLKSKLKASGPLIAAAAAAVAAGFVKMAVNMAAAEQVVSNQTESLLKVQGVMWAEVGAAVDGYMKQLERLTGYNDTDLQDSFNRLLSAGMSYNEALENMSTVTSLAYSKNLDLATSADLIGRAHNGVTGSLTRYGIVLGENQTIQEYVNENLADAADRTKTYQGQMDILRNSLMNTAEAFGAELLPAIIDTMQAINRWGEGGGWSLITDGLFLFIDGARIMIAHIRVAINSLQGLYAGLRMVQAAFRGNFDAAKEWKDELVKNVREVKQAQEDAAQATFDLGGRIYDMADTVMHFGEAAEGSGDDVDYLSMALGKASGEGQAFKDTMDEAGGSLVKAAGNVYEVENSLKKLADSYGLAESSMESYTAAELIRMREMEKATLERMGLPSDTGMKTAMDIRWSQQEAEKAKKKAEEEKAEAARIARLEQQALELTSEEFLDYAIKQIEAMAGVQMSRAERDELKKQGTTYGYSREMTAVGGDPFWWTKGNRGIWRNAAPQLNEDLLDLKAMVERNEAAEAEKMAEIERLREARDAELSYRAEQGEYTGTGAAGSRIFNINVYIDSIVEATTYETVLDMVTNAVQDAVRGNG